MNRHYLTLSEFIKNYLHEDVEELMKRARKLFPQNVVVYDIKKFKKYVSKVKKRMENSFSDENKLYARQKKLFMDILESSKEPISVIDFCNYLKCSPEVLGNIINEYRSHGHEISVTNFMISKEKSIHHDIDRVYENPISNDKEIIFGVVSDLHFGSSSCQITALNEFAEICKKRGVEHILVAGDILAGHNVYPGQNMDLYALGADEQEQSCLLNLPKGFQWYMIGGNHDYSFIKQSGHNAIRYLSYKRNDIHYLGFDEATIQLLPNVSAKLWHPSGGCPYSVSYRLQKGIERITIDELYQLSDRRKENTDLRFFFAGHLHIQMQALFGGICGMQCGTFEGSTNYLKRKGLVPNVGGYIIEATVDEDRGTLKDFMAKFYLFREIENDWMNYKHSTNEESLLSPILSK